VATVEPRLYIALYTDADVHGKLAGQIRARGFDAVSADEVGNKGLDDLAQLEYAVTQRRVLLTHNARDFEPLAKEYWNTGKDHFGIVVSQKLPIGELLRRVLKMLNTVDADEMKNSYRDLGEFK
jgi:hypothetical protein